MLLILLAMLIISLPTVLILFFGLLPTIVAFIVDRTKQRYAAFCVGGMNFSGVFPYLLDVWYGRHTVDEAMTVLTDVFALMVMYSSSAFGWIIYVMVPPVITTFLSVINERRISILRTRQREIIAEWGEDVDISRVIAANADTAKKAGPKGTAAAKKAEGKNATAKAS